jgi:hypothetical protein
MQTKDDRRQMLVVKMCRYALAWWSSDPKRTSTERQLVRDALTALERLLWLKAD